MLGSKVVAVAQSQDTGTWREHCSYCGCPLEFAFPSAGLELHPLVKVAEDLTVDPFVPRIHSVALLAPFAYDQDFRCDQASQIVQRNGHGLPKEPTRWLGRLKSDVWRRPIHLSEVQECNALRLLGGDFEGSADHADRVRGDPQLGPAWEQAQQLSQHGGLNAGVEMEFRFIKANQRRAKFCRCDVDVEQQVEDSLLASGEVLVAELPDVIPGEVERTFRGRITNPREAQVRQDARERLLHRPQHVPGGLNIASSISVQLRQQGKEPCDQSLVVLAQGCVRLDHSVQRCALAEFVLLLDRIRQYVWSVPVGSTNVHQLPQRV